MIIVLEGFLIGIGATLGYLAIMTPISCCAYAVKPIKIHNN